ncbi:oxidoreductase [Paenibacillus sp. FSL W7-1287]|uniref:oxidoreductase n=1 Tax=Paenibacillus sp. FSL W7-1287 TaxID=2954538 RepID=UPI0030F9EAC6
MKHINHLTTVRSSRYDRNDPAQEGNKNTEFFDFIIDGQSLYQWLKKYDMVPALGWGSQVHQKQMQDYFVLNKMHPSLYYRYPILVCPWCGDEECGFISVFIERHEDYVIWKDFKLEPNNITINIGPFFFEWANYKAAILKAYRTE